MSKACVCLVWTPSAICKKIKEKCSFLGGKFVLFLEGENETLLFMCLLSRRVNSNAFVVRKIKEGGLLS